MAKPYGRKDDDKKKTPSLTGMSGLEFSPETENRTGLNGVALGESAAMGSTEVQNNIVNSADSTNKYEAYFENLATQQVSSESKYAQYFRELEQNNLDQLNNSIRIASMGDADQAAEIQKLAQETGLDPSIISGNVAEVKRQIELQNIDTQYLASQSPILAEQLRNPAFAAIAFDDTESLSTIEKTTQFIKGFWGSAKAGSANMAASSMSVLSAVPDRFSDYATFFGASEDNVFSKAADSMQGQAKSWFELAEERQGDLSALSPEVQSFLQGVSSAFSMAPGFAATVLTKNPAFMAGTGGVLSGGMSYTNALDEGLDSGDALTYAMTQASIEIGTEYIPAFKLLENLKMGDSFFKSLMGQLAYELPQEQIATVLQEYTDLITLPSQAEMTFGDYLEQRPESAYHTLFATLGGVGTQTSIAYAGNYALNKAFGEGVEVDPLLKQYIDDNGRATEAQQVHASIVQLAEQIKESKTAQRDQSAIKAYIAELFQSQVEGETTPEVVVFYQDLVEYAEAQGIDLRDISPLINEQIDGVVNSAGYFSFKIEDYLTEIANGEHAEGMNQILRIHENAMSVAEASAWSKEANQDLLDQAETIIASMENRDIALGEDVYDEVVNQLTSIGVPREEANQSAALYKAFFVVMGDRAGVDPKQLFDRYNLNIQRNLPEGVIRNIQSQTLGELVDIILKPDEEVTAPVEDILEQISGETIAQQAQDIGTADEGMNDQETGGFLPETLDDIRKENYINQTINIEELTKNNPDLQSTIESGVRPFEGEAFAMKPIVSSEGRVIDGWNRIAQLVEDGVTEINVLQGVEATEEVVEETTETVTPEQTQQIRDYLEKEMGVDLGVVQRDELIDLIRTNFYDPQGRVLEQAAFHGTGFADVIERFSTDFINTGEGAQAFGWGLYFASQKEVADFYRATALDSGRLTHENFTVKKDNVELDITSDEHQLVVMAAYDIPLPLRYALGEIENRIEDLETEYWSLDGMNYLDIPYQEIKEAIKTGEVDRQAEENNGVITKAQKKELIRVADELMDEQAQLELGNEILSNEDKYEVIPDASEGKTYQVELAPKDEDYLLWDAELNDQSDKVKKVINKLKKEHKLGAAGGLNYGRDFYRQLGYITEVFTDTTNKYRYPLPEDEIIRALQEASSKLLLQEGIRGIKFADGNTRQNYYDGGKVDWNFVIFDDKDVEITKVFNQSSVEAQAQEPSIEELINAKQGNTFFQTASIRSGKENLDKYGLDVTQRNNNAAVAKALESRQREKYGFIDFNDHSKEAQSKVAGWITTEIKHEVNKVSDENSAVGWYSTKFQQAIDTLGAKYPEFLNDKLFKKSTNPGLKALGSKQNARDFFTLLVAITSDGQKVQQNFALADQIYSEFKETGVLPEEGNFGGERIASMLRNMRRINKMVEEKGFEGTRDFLLQVKTVGELTKIAAAQGLKFDSGFKVTAKMPMSTVVIGDKLGTFYANLMAREGYVTMDRWFSRTINRYRGDLLQKPTKVGLKRFRDLIGQPNLTDEETILETIPYQKSYSDRGFKDGTEIEKAANTIHKAAFGGLNDVPRNKSDREFMTNVMENARKRLKRSGIDLTVADMQAILWYYEKRLYGELGARASADISYEEAAERIINNEPAPFTQTAEGPGGTVVGLSNPTYDQMQRGSIQFRSDQTVISLFEGADRSTFLHESGHLFLEVMRDLGEDPQAPNEIKEEWKKILNFLEVNSGAEIGTPQHEKWAESFEKYLFEGKAPSVELQGVFNRFKAWLKGVYQQLKNLNVEINDEIRGIFDRMLATPSQIKEAEEVSRFVPLFESLEKSGMTQSQWNDYQDTANRATIESEADLDRKKLNEVTREDKKWYREELKKVKAQVEDEVSKMPVYQVIHFLQTGEVLQGEALPGLEPMKLDKKALVDEFGEILNQLPRGRRIHSTKGGIHHDLVAEIFGFKSGIEMVKAIMNAQPRKKYIEAVARERLMIAQKDMSLDRQKLEEEAIKSAHATDQRGRFLQIELAALAKSANMSGTPASAARQAAINILNNKKVQEIQPGRYRAAEAAAGRATEKALAKNNFVEATKQARARLLNHYLYREAVSRQEEVDKFVRYFTRLQKPATRKRLARDYIDQIYTLLEKIDIKKSVTKKARERRMSFAKWVESQMLLGNEIAFSDEMIALLESSEKIHYKDMQFDELKAVYENIRSIEHNARWKQRLLDQRAKMDFDATVEEMVEVARREHKEWKVDKPDFTDSKLSKAAEAWQEFHASHDKIEYIAQAMDGYETNGVWHTTVFKPIADAEDAEAIMHETYIKKLNDIMTKHYTAKERRSWNKKVTTSQGTFNKRNILAMALNWGNEENRIALLSGFETKKGWKFSGPDVEAILNSNMQEKDWQMVQEVWDMIDELWPEISALQKELTGIVPPKVEATPFDTPFGTMRGGYYPLSYDPDKSDKQRRRTTEEQIKDLFENSFSKAATKTGHTKERVGSDGQMVRLDLNVLSEHLHNVIHDLTHRKAIIQINKFLTDIEVQEAVQGVLGKKVYDAINPWLKAVAAPQQNYIGTLDRMANWTRHSATIVAMGFKVTTAMVQPLGYSQSVAYLGEKWAMKGLTSFYRNPHKNRNAILEKSVFMRNRTRTLDRDVRESMNRITGSQSRIKDMQSKYFFFIGFMDMTVSLPTWQAAYEKAIKEGLSEKEAIANGDQAVRMTQGSGGMKDLARVQQGTPTQKLFTMFYSYFSAYYNMSKRTIQMRKEGKISTFEAFRHFMWLTILPAVLSEIMLGRGPDEDDDESWAAWSTKTLGTYPFLGMVWVRDIANMMGNPNFGTALPYTDVIDSIVNAGWATSDLFTEDEFNEVDVKNIMLGISFALKIPGRQIANTFEHLYEIFSEGEDLSFFELLVKRDRDD